jgi:hypothetical protein
MRDFEVKTAGLEISGDAEVMEVTKATCDALSHLEEAVDRFTGGISQAGFEISQNTVEVFFERSGEFAERFESGTIGPAQPPAQRRPVAVGQYPLGEPHARRWRGPASVAAKIDYDESVSSAIVFCGFNTLKSTASSEHELR